MASTILSDNGVSSGSAGIKTTADSTGTLALQTTTAGGAATTAVTIDTSQNVGIGTNTPITYTTGTVIAVNSSGAETIPLALVNSNGAANTQVSLAFTPNTNIPLAKISAIRTSAGGLTAMTFGTFSGSAVTEAMRIDSSLNVMTGATSATFASNTFKFSVTEGSSYTPMGINCTTPGTGSSNVFVFARNGTLTGAIAVTGTTTAYNTSSDYRLKQDITPMTGALAKVSTLKPVTYKWKLDGSDGEGFIAHELSEICPNAVNGKKDAVDADGNPIYQGIDTSFLVATLTAAIQEQQALITALTARIETLENKT